MSAYENDFLIISFFMYYTYIRDDYVLKSYLVDKFRKWDRKCLIILILYLLLQKMTFENILFSNTVLIFAFVFYAHYIRDLIYIYTDPKSDKFYISTMCIFFLLFDEDINTFSHRVWLEIVA